MYLVIIHRIHLLWFIYSIYGFYLFCPYIYIIIHILYPSIPYYDPLLSYIYHRWRFSVPSTSKMRCQLSIFRCIQVSGLGPSGPADQGRSKRCHQWFIHKGMVQGWICRKLIYEIEWNGYNMMIFLWIYRKLAILMEIEMEWNEYNMI